MGTVETEPLPSEETVPALAPVPDPAKPARRKRVSGEKAVWKTTCTPELDHEVEWGGQPTMRFFPDHFLSEATAMLLLLSLYALLAIFMPAGLEIKANPLATPTGIKPEWYFLFLYAFLHYVPVVVGVMGSLAGFVFLAAIPWIDRNPSRKPRTRIFAIAASIMLLAGVVVLTVIGLMD